MKIVVISGNPLQETFGGVEEHTSHILRALSCIKGSDIHFITYGRFFETFEHDNITVHSLNRHSANKIFYPIILPLDIIEILRKIKEINPDIVHFQGTHPHYCFSAIICQCKYPTILTVHGLLARELEFLPNINPLAKCFSRYSEKLALFLLKNIIVVAPQIEVIVKPMTKAKIFVIPNGINPDIIRGINPFPINYINTILFVGNLIKRKGIADLIKAISIVKKDIPDVHLLIAGTGSMENELKNLTTILLLENNVKFLGFLTEKTKFAYILSVDILVVPSLWESLPIVVLEGMICGKPIIASHVAGIPYLIHNDENGFLVEPRNSEKFAEKICTLLQNKSLREKMGKRSLEQVKELTWDKIASMTYTTYNAVIFREDIHK